MELTKEGQAALRIILKAAQDNGIDLKGKGQVADITENRHLKYLQKANEWDII